MTLNAFDILYTLENSNEIDALFLEQAILKSRFDKS